MATTLAELVLGATVNGDEEVATPTSASFCPARSSPKEGNLIPKREQIPFAYRSVWRCSTSLQAFKMQGAI